MAMDDLDEALVKIFLADSSSDIPASIIEPIDTNEHQCEQQPHQALGFLSI
jgi:hypothetical protein